LTRLIHVDSLSVPGLEPYRTMRRPLEHRELGIFVAEGEKVVRRLVESELKIVSILLTEGWLETYSSFLTNREIEDAVYVAGKGLLEQIVGYRLHQGIMAIGRVPDQVSWSNSLTKHHRPRLLVAADGISNSENMGVIVRNCAAFGVDALVVGETSCDPYLRRAVRNSMGTAFRLRISKVGKLADTLTQMLEEHTFTIIAAHPREDSENLAEIDLSGDVCFVFGSEGEGISGEVLSKCTRRVKIPMQNNVDSINVAASVGICLYEAVRQRS